MFTDWPEWLTEARAALIVSIASAIFTGMGLIYARRMAKNDTERMRRKDLVVEADFKPLTDKRPGWLRVYLTVRNLEHVSAKITAVSVRKRHQNIITMIDALGLRTSPLGHPKLMDEFPPGRRCELALVVPPLRLQGNGQTTGGVAHLSFYVGDVTSISDLVIDWQWADGQKR